VVLRKMASCGFKKNGESWFWKKWRVVVLEKMTSCGLKKNGEFRYTDRLVAKL
jgi:hypothetical protein